MTYLYSALTKFLRLYSRTPLQRVPVADLFWGEINWPGNNFQFSIADIPYCGVRATV